MVGHPTVMAEAHRESVSIHPQLRLHPDLTVVTYQRTRVYLDRDAWEMLQPTGVLVMHVRPTGAERYVLALTLDELEDTFGEVKATASWSEARCYHFPNPPAAASRFRVYGR
jgi:hypothetical protein